MLCKGPSASATSPIALCRSPAVNLTKERACLGTTRPAVWRFACSWVFGVSCGLPCLLCSGRQDACHEAPFLCSCVPVFPCRPVVLLSCCAAARAFGLLRRASTAVTWTLSSTLPQLDPFCGATAWPFALSCALCVAVGCGTLSLLCSALRLRTPAAGRACVACVPCVGLLCAACCVAQPAAVPGLDPQCCCAAVRHAATGTGYYCPNNTNRAFVWSVRTASASTRQFNPGRTLPCALCSPPGRYANRTRLSSPDCAGSSAHLVLCRALRR